MEHLEQEVMKTRELFNTFGINADEILILQKQYADFPVKGMDGSYTARIDELKRWHRAHPGVLKWSELHFRYDGYAR